MTDSDDPEHTTPAAPGAGANAAANDKAGNSSNDIASNLSVVRYPTAKDILCGRGAPVSEHVGNTALRSMVMERQEEYIEAVSRVRKHAIAKDICRQVAAAGGRFLRKSEDDEQDGWVVVTDQRLISNKIKQLLRDMAPEARQRRAQRKRSRMALGSTSTTVPTQPAPSPPAVHTQYPPPPPQQQHRLQHQLLQQTLLNPQQLQPQQQQVQQQLLVAMLMTQQNGINLVGSTGQFWPTGSTTTALPATASGSPTVGGMSYTSLASGPSVSESHNGPIQQSQQSHSNNSLAANTHNNLLAPASAVDTNPMDEDIDPFSSDEEDDDLNTKAPATNASPNLLDHQQQSLAVPMQFSSLLNLVQQGKSVTELLQVFPGLEPTPLPFANGTNHNNGRSDQSYSQYRPTLGTQNGVNPTATARLQEQGTPSPSRMPPKSTNQPTLNGVNTLTSSQQRLHSTPSDDTGKDAVEGNISLSNLPFIPSTPYPDECARLAPWTNQPAANCASVVYPTNDAAALYNGTNLNPVGQMMLLQKLGLDPTPRRESNDLNQTAPPETAARGAPLHTFDIQAGCTSGLLSDDAIPSSHLLSRVRDFLPRIHAANATIESGTGGQLDADLVNNGDAGSPDQQRQEKEPSQGGRDANDSSSLSAPSLPSTLPTIQLDLTLGVDTNHPAMTFLNAAGESDTLPESERSAQNKDESAKRRVPVEQSIERMLLRTGGPSSRAKGPLISEVLQSDDS